jgi:ABC-type polysaccharide/polyol phosphate export permease
LISRILVGHVFDMSNIDWFSLFAVLAFGCLCCVSYHMLAAIILKRVEQIGTFWFRVNFVLLVFGGTWIPHYVMASIIPALDRITYLNPITYITEGLRQSIIGGSRFLPISTCIITLMVFSVLFTTLSCYALKKRIDHI